MRLQYIEGLTAQPWWDRSYFEWVPALESHSEVITEELARCQLSECFKSDSRYAQTMGAGWTAFRLQRFGQWIESNSALFPRTVTALRTVRIPLAVRGVMFARQLPGSGVAPHSDGRNFVLTAHLGLRVPRDRERCWIRVGGEQRSWTQGETLLFDTSFVHETQNDTPEERYVLIVDFWHPELTTAERESLQYIYEARNLFDAGREREIVSSYWNSRNKGDFLGAFSGLFNRS